MLFMKWQQNHNLADGTYINHYSTNARILNLIILYIWPKWHCTLVQEMACRFQCWKNLSCLTSPISPLLFLWKWKGLLLKKKKISDAGIFFSWGSILWSFFFSWGPFYLCKSTILPCLEYSRYFWAGTPSYYLDILDKQQKWTCRTVAYLNRKGVQSQSHVLAQSILKTLSWFVAYQKIKWCDSFIFQTPYYTFCNFWLFIYIDSFT